MKPRIILVLALLLLPCAFTHGYFMKYGTLTSGNSINVSVNIQTHGANMKAFVWLGSGGTLNAQVTAKSPSGAPLIAAPIKSSASQQPASVVFKKGNDGNYVFTIKKVSGKGNFTLFVGSKSEWKLFLDWLNSR